VLLIGFTVAIEIEDVLFAVLEHFHDLLAVIFAINIQERTVQVFNLSAVGLAPGGRSS